MKAIIFDLGNVLVPYDHCRTVRAVAALCKCDANLIDTLFESLHDVFGQGRIDADEFCRRMLEGTDAPATITCAAFFDAFCAGVGRDDVTLAYAVELQARPDVTVGVISNTNQVHVAWLDEHVPELAALDLVMMSNEVELLKPDPEIFLLALELLGIEPTDACFVDDQPGNVAAAAALGMHALLHRSWAETGPAIEAWLAA